MSNRPEAQSTQAIEGNASVASSVEQRRPDQLSHVGRQGSVHVHGLAIHPSRLWSPEYKAFFAAQVDAALASADFPVPARNAAKSEWDEFDSWWDRRNNAALLSEALTRWPVNVREETIAGVRAATIVPREGVAPENEHRVLINLHGGGFVYHRGLSFGQLESIPVASIGRIKVVTLDYRQAPFYGYPAASDDVEAVYRELLNQYSPEAIGIFGCSAGGTLTAQVVSRFQTKGLPRPGAVGIFSIAPMPFCDRPPWGRDWGDSGIWFSGLIPKNEMSAADNAFWGPTRWYMEGADANDVEAYPGSSDGVLARFPPTLFLSATRDFTMSAVAFTHARLLRLGVDSSLYIMEGGGHGAHVVAEGTPEANDAQAYIARWFLQHLASPTRR